LARERARNAGLEHGIAALEHRVRMLSAELKNLRRHGR
jgi:BMFP domain-containing protein YqiC